jgi:threonine/homoserine/homoserine lactone efflux protein
MPPIDLLTAFFLAAFVFAYMPGPALLYTAAQTMARGRRAGWFAVIGIHLGGYAHVAAAALGLAVLFQAVPVLYAVLKFAGAAYLIWLGVRLFTSKAALATTSLEIDAKSPGSTLVQVASLERGQVDPYQKMRTTVRVHSDARCARRAFWESVTVEVLNPKAAIFYLAFLPQFTDPAASFPIWLQLMALGMLVNLVFTSADIVCVILADKVTSVLKRSRAAGRLAQRIGGGILVALGLNRQ